MKGDLFHNNTELLFNKNSQSRVFGKDITNQVKINDQPSVIRKSSIQVQSTDKNILTKNLVGKVNRCKNLSMEENLLNKHLNHCQSYANINFKENFNLLTNNLHEKNIIPRDDASFNFFTNNYLDNNNNNIIISDKLNDGKNNLNLRRTDTFKNKKRNEMIIVNIDNTNKSISIPQNSLLKNHPHPIENLDDSNIYMKTVSSEEGEIPLKYKKPTIFITEEVDLYYNPQPELEYIDEIYETLLIQENSQIINPDFLKYQEEINERMRIILIEWIVEVINKFKLKTETLFLTVNLIDTFLSLKKVKKNQLQLVGAASIFIASKYEEIYFPEIRDLIYICDKAFKSFEILGMESEILFSIEFRIKTVFPYNFLQIISIKLKLNEFDRHFCSLMVELFLFEFRSIRYLPSIIACACIYITMKIKKMTTKECNKILLKFCSYNKEEVFERVIKECAQLICLLLDNINKPYLKNIKEKYSKIEFSEVSNFKIFN